MAEKIVGILGGMGPRATIDFFTKVVDLTPSQKDQDHLRIIIDNNPKIPDRTKAILDKDDTIVSSLVSTAKNLEKAGAELLAIPCNTAHYFYEELQKQVGIPILHIVRETIAEVKLYKPYCRKIGLLATTGTIISGLYQKEFERSGFKILVPGTEYQTMVMEAIIEIKAGQEENKARERLIEAGRHLIEQGSGAIILACTEVPLVIKDDDFVVPVFNATLILAKATVRAAFANNT